MSVPSGYTKLGTIGYSDKGDYSSAITYSYMNVVHYNGNVYFSKQDNNTNNLPTNTSWWGVMIQGGATDMTGATSSTDGVHGLVPQPEAGDNKKALYGDGEWKYISEQKTVTLYSANWVNKAQTVTVTGIKSTTNGVIGIPIDATKNMREIIKRASINMTAQSDNSITFTCDGEIPDINIDVSIIIFI